MLRKSPYSLPASQYGGGRKRIFIGLMLASCCVACLALAFFLILPWSDYGQTLTWLPLLCMLVGGAGILALIWMCGTLVWHVYTGRYLPGVSSVRHVTIRLFFPLMELLAKVVRMERKRVRHSFIKVNNELVLADRPRVRPERLLLLLRTASSAVPARTGSIIMWTCAAVADNAPWAVCCSCGTVTVSIWRWPPAGPSPGASWSRRGPA